MADQTKILMTAAEFEALPESRHPIQLIEGELFEVPAPDYEHQILVTDVSFILKNLRPDGRTVVAPLAIFLDDQNVLEPDVMWIAPDSSAVVRPNGRGLQGAPDLVIEILSPSTARRDKSTKFTLYEKHGAHEYWLIDPTLRQIDVWTLTENRFARLGTFGAHESFTSPLLGKTVDLKVLFSD